MTPDMTPYMEASLNFVYFFREKQLRVYGYGQAEAGVHGWISEINFSMFIII